MFGCDMVSDRRAHTASVTFAILVGCATPLVAGQTEYVLPEGPWGNVELVPIEIRLPESMVPDVPLPLQPWTVDRGRDETARLLSDVGVDSALAEQLLSTYDASGGGVLRPGVEMIRSLDAGPRAALYEALRRIAGNTSQQAPHRFRRTRLAERFRDLEPSTLELMKEFLYERADLPASVLLADLPAVMQLAGSRRERTRLIQAVSEQETLLLRLKLDTHSRSVELSEYWGRGGRRRDLEILIGSLVDKRSPQQIDAIYLLPAFARSFVLTYPRLETARDRDCFWTALNFFAPNPDDRLVGPKVAHTLVEDYQIVRGPLQLGDVLVLWRPNGEAEHAAVYIAADIYFTKNGNNLAMPWLFMSLADILERYDQAERSPLTHYRLKKLE